MITSSDMKAFGRRQLADVRARVASSVGRLAAAHPTGVRLAEVDVRVLGRRLVVRARLAPDGFWSTRAVLPSGTDFRLHHVVGISIHEVPGVLPALRLVVGPLSVIASTEKVS